MPSKILVSSCLTGEKCAYDGKDRTVSAVRELCKRFGCVRACPEVDGGLGCPREFHEITGNTGEDVLDGKARVLSFSGEDRTEHFIRGAKAALKKALRNSVSIAVMKARSPSCGRGRIYSGKFDGTLCDGNGVTAALLMRHGIKVFTEEEIGRIEQELLDA